MSTMKKLFPIILAVIGLGAGVGAGAFLRPAPEPIVEATVTCDEGDEGCEMGVPDMPLPAPVVEPDPDEIKEYVSLPKQFVVPVVKKERVRSLVVLTISLEVEVGTSDAALAKTPKLRDVLLQVLFNHANSGGFDGAFTTGRSMSDLRGELLEEAQKVLGSSVHSVLIEEIVKQAM